MYEVINVVVCECLMIIQQIILQTRQRALGGEAIVIWWCVRVSSDTLQRMVMQEPPGDSQATKIPQTSQAENEYKASTSVSWSSQPLRLCGKNATQ